MTETWRQRNRDKWNAYSKLWRAKRKEELGDYWSEYNNRWRINHPERYLFQRAKSRAKKSNIVFDLCEEDIKIPEKCPVLGIPLEIKIKPNLDSSPSIDRLDCTKGYTKDNINVISWRANNLKSNGTLDEFKSLVKWMEKSG